MLREFPYHPNRVTSALMFFVVCCGACMFVYWAVYGDRGAIVHGIQLTPMQLRIIAGIVAAFSPIAVLPLGLLLIASFRRDCRVAVTADSVILPKLSCFGVPTGQELEIGLDEIVSITVSPFVGKARVLRLVHREETFQVFSNMFANRADFDVFEAFLSAVLTDRNARRGEDGTMR